MSCMVVLCLALWKLFKLFVKVAVSFYIPSSGMWGFLSLHIFANIIVCLIYDSHSGGYEMASYCDLLVCIDNNTTPILITIALWCVLKPGSVANLFFFKVLLAVLGPLHFRVNLRILLSISTKKKCLLGFWVEIALILLINYEGIYMLTVSTLLIYKHTYIPQFL